MSDALRTILLIALAAAALTTGALWVSWWMEPERRLRRAMKKALGDRIEAVAITPFEGRAAALDFDAGLLGVFWDRGANGLIYEFEEVIGGEVIVDGHVVARIRRHEPRKSLDIMAPDASQVTLRLMFEDARNPEFELSLWSAIAPAQTGSPAEAMRLGRRWLSHLDALLKG